MSYYGMTWTQYKAMMRMTPMPRIVRRLGLASLWVSRERWVRAREMAMREE